VSCPSNLQNEQMLVVKKIKTNSRLEYEGLSDNSITEEEKLEPNGRLCRISSLPSVIFFQFKE